MGDKEKSDIEFDLVEAIESPVHGLGSKKFSEVISCISVWSQSPFTHLSNEKIVRISELILQPDGKKRLSKMRGIGRSTLEKVKKYYSYWVRMRRITGICH